MGENGTEVGVHVTLREIYDTAKMGAAAADGARGDIAALRQDVQRIDGRVAAIEREQRNAATPAYLKRAGYALGLVAAGVAAGWGALHGGG